MEHPGQSHLCAKLIALRLHAVAVVLLLAFCFLPARAEAPFTVQWTDKGLSVVAEGAPLAEVLTQVAARTRLEIRGLEKVQGNTWADFSDLPLREALKKLLATVNYAILEKPSGKLAAAQVQLVILGSVAGRGVAESVADQAPSAPELEAEPDLGADQPVPEDSVPAQQF